MPRNPTPTNADIRKVALEAGVSIATVSRVLNNPQRVSAATRERVLEAAARLGYRPNPLGQRLRKGRAETVGVVIPAPQGRFADSFFLELLAGLGEGLSEVGLDLLVTTSPPGPQELSCYQRLVESKRVDGLVLARTRRLDERIVYLLKRKIPFVAHGRSDLIDEPFPYLDIDGEQGFHKATQHLLNLGHRDIAFIGAPHELNFAQHRLKGYQRALAEAGLPLRAEWVLEGDLSEESGYQLTQALLGLPQPPTALLCANDLMALGALRALRERGLKAGREVSVIGYDDILLAHYTDPPLSTLHQPFHAMGRRLVEMLLARLGGAPAEELQEIWVPELILRGSDGPPQS
ncbi:LacI family DNA-binding transcriptional regulator [Calidithermus roseus]|uniref:HTH-type transcriptional repressor CytR n=1 Tax=Calidithermus roseus TaxID=1644118 RepID=A0A399EV32_9DEIN|nr:LacI family DNA-binding transcriptional regulator [Calidithermus roseus]RIH86482.1 HTH-type transcriptional repressor CytR [Calidithermus roseus]